MATAPVTRMRPVKAAEDNGPMMSHSICVECYPTDFIGIKALCGEKLLGIQADPRAQKCDPCEEFDHCPVCGIIF